MPGPFAKIASHAALKTKVGDTQNLAVYIGNLKFQESGKTRIRPEFMKFQEASMLLLHKEDLHLAHIDFENYAFGEIYALDSLEGLHNNGFQIIVFRRGNTRDRKDFSQ